MFYNNTNTHMHAHLLMEGIDMAVKTTVGSDTAVEQVSFEGGSERGRRTCGSLRHTVAQMGWRKIIFHRQAGVG